LSVRGPIVSPHLAALVLTPVAPHMLFDLSLVLAPDEPVRIEVLDDVPANLLADGRQVATLEGGDAVVCRTGPHNARFVSFGRRQFFRIVKTKFGLADR
jgi:NAD+ kinase